MDEGKALNGLISEAKTTEEKERLETIKKEIKKIQFHERYFDRKVKKKEEHISQEVLEACFSSQKSATRF